VLKVSKFIKSSSMIGNMGQGQSFSSAFLFPSQYIVCGIM